MSNRLSRDTEDAAKVLAALRDQYHPQETLAEKLSASEDLRAKLVNVTGGVRQWGVKSFGDDTLVSLNAAGSVRIHTDPATGYVLVGKEGDPFEPARLEYDPVVHDWIGSEVDTDLVLPQGERRPRKSALVALCEQIVALLGKPPES